MPLPPGGGWSAARSQADFTHAHNVGDARRLSTSGRSAVTAGGLSGSRGCSAAIPPSAPWGPWTDTLRAESSTGPSRRAVVADSRARDSCAGGRCGRDGRCGRAAAAARASESSRTFRRRARPLSRSAPVTPRTARPRGQVACARPRSTTPLGRPDRDEPPALAATPRRDGDALDRVAGAGASGRIDWVDDPVVRAVSALAGPVPHTAGAAARPPRGHLVRRRRCAPTRRQPRGDRRAGPPIEPVSDGVVGAGAQRDVVAGFRRRRHRRRRTRRPGRVPRSAASARHCADAPRSTPPTRSAPAPTRCTTSTP